MTAGSSPAGLQALDHPESFDRLDTEGVLATVEAFADQCRTGWEIGRSASGLPSAEGADSILVLGMGGSGISGDIARAVLEPRLPLPWRVIKGYGPVPEWVGRNTLVFAVSYSGDTAETLEALEGVHERGARVIAISSGGAMADRAKDYGIAHVRIPAGQQPRASLGYLLMPLLAVLQEVGLIPQLDDDVAETTEVLGDLARRCGRARLVPGIPPRSWRQ